MIYYYHISYDENKDEFWAIVDRDINDKESKPIFTIDSTEEMIAYIESEVMEHIDDVDGLEILLVKQGLIKVSDTVLISEEPLY